MYETAVGNQNIGEHTHATRILANLVGIVARCLDFARRVGLIDAL
jgi:hypothetical protein